MQRNAGKATDATQEYTPRLSFRFGRLRQRRSLRTFLAFAAPDENQALVCYKSTYHSQTASVILAVLQTIHLRMGLHDVGK